jgi:hypothetical protein
MAPSGHAAAPGNAITVNALWILWYREPVHIGIVSRITRYTLYGVTAVMTARQHSSAAYYF